MSSSFHHSPNRPRSSPRTPSSSPSPYHNISSSSMDQQDLRSSSPSVFRSSSEIQSAAATVAHYSRQAQHIVAQHQQRDAGTSGTPNNPIIALSPTASSTPPRPSALTSQQRSRSTPNSASRLARYSFPSIASNNNHNNNNKTPSPTIRHATSWNHPTSNSTSTSTTRSSIDSNDSYVMKSLQRLRGEHAKLKESHLALQEENQQFQLQTEDLKTKTVQLEARLLESMQARSSREHKFQEEMKRQRSSMNALFVELADSKREVELLKSQLKDTFTKLQLQQALTANIAFQQEQEELEYQMEQEQFRKQQQQEGQHPPSQPGAGGGNYYPNETAVPSSIVGSSNNHKTTIATGDSGFSRLGNFFNRRRVGSGPNLPHAATMSTTTTSSTGASSSSTTTAAPLSSYAAPSKTSSQTTTTIGHFNSYEESKNDLFEQMQDHYGATTSSDDVHKLFDTETTTTVTTEDSSSNPAASRFVLSSEDYLKTTITPQLSKSPLRRRPTINDKEEEMNYGQTSASMPPPATMSRLDRIRQKRRNIEAMFRQNGASPAVLPSKNKSQGLAPRRGRTNYSAAAQTSASRSRNNNNLVNLMNHRRYDD